MCCRTCALVKLTNENSKQRPDESDQSEKPETVEKPENGRLLLHDGINLGDGARRRIDSRVTVINEATGDPLHICRNGSIEPRDVRHQYRLVVLRSPGQHRGDEGNAEACALIAEQVGKTRRFVVLVLGKIRVGQLTHRYK